MPKISLNDRPGSITRAQMQKLVLAGKDRGLVRGTDVSGLREACGVISLRALSRAAAHHCIKRISGHDLPNEPGKKASAYAGKRPTDATRMITDEHVEQITRLGLIYFDGDEGAFFNWFEKTWKCRDPWKIGTAEVAGQVIVVLKDMVNRKEVRCC